MMQAANQPAKSFVFEPTRAADDDIGAGRETVSLILTIVRSCNARDVLRDNAFVISCAVL